MQASDYVSIDADLSTEESRDDVANFIPSQVTDDSTDEEECEKEDESLVIVPSVVNDFPSAIESIRDLTTFISLKGDTQALKYLTQFQLRLHLEKSAMCSKTLKQTLMTSHFSK